MKQARLTKSKTPWPKDKVKKALLPALKQAATDWEYRDRCLSSSRSAKEAITEASGEPVPNDVEIKFYPREELDYIFVVEVPKFDPGNPNINPDPNDHVLCTWNQYQIKTGKGSSRKQANAKRQ
jgi:hypothetical protein